MSIIALNELIELIAFYLSILSRQAAIHVNGDNC